MRSARRHVRHPARTRRGWAVALACAAALANLAIWREEPVLERIASLSARQEQRLKRLGNRLLATLHDEYGKMRVERVAEQVIVDHGATPVDDLYFARQEFLAAGYGVEDARPLPDIDRLFIRDPDSNRVELISLSPGGVA